MTVHGDVISHVNISHVTVEDGGEYRCVAENRAGQAHHAARLNVYGEWNSGATPALLRRLRLGCLQPQPQTLALSRRHDSV